jgi:hypothetical protein
MYSIDVDAACGGPGQARRDITATPYHWRCASTGKPVLLSDVCQGLYGNDATVGTADQNDPTDSWRCRIPVLYEPDFNAFCTSANADLPQATPTDATNPDSWACTQSG